MLGRNDPERLEAEANEIIAKMTGMKREPEVLAENTESGENTEQTADPSPDSSAAQQESPAPASDSQAGEENGVSDPEEDWAKKVRIAEERVKNTQSRMHKATAEAAELRKANAALNERLSQLEERVAVSDDPDLKSLEEDYPDIAKPLLAKISQLEKRLQQSTSTFQQKVEDSALAEHLNTIRTAHSDFDEVAASEDFAGWIDRQSPVWRRIASTGTAGEVIELIDRYKEVLTPKQSAGKPSDKARSIAEPKLPKARQQKTEGGSEKRIWTRAEINSMPLTEYAKHEAEIDKAMVEGRIR